MLQSRLLDSQGEVPELPDNIDLSQPRPDMPIPPPGAVPGGPAPGVPTQGTPQQHQTAHQPGLNDDMNSLNQIAVAGLGMRKRPNDDGTNYLGNNFQAKRRNDGTQPGSSDVSKTEMTHGMPMS